MNSLFYLRCLKCGAKADDENKETDWKLIMKDEIVCYHKQIITCYECDVCNGLDKTCPGYSPDWSIEDDWQKKGKSCLK